jgi:hypothetical protein
MRIALQQIARRDLSPVPQARACQIRMVQIRKTILCF